MPSVNCQLGAASTTQGRPPPLLHLSGDRSAVRNGINVDLWVRTRGSIEAQRQFGE